MKKVNNQFMICSLIILLGGIFLSLEGSSKGILHISDLKTFHSLLKKSKKPVFVDFYADWCGPCRRMGKVLKKVAAKYSKSMIFVKVNVDKAPALCREYGIRGIPACFIIYNEKVIESFVGFHDKETVEELIKKVLLQLKSQKGIEK